MTCKFLLVLGAGILCVGAAASSISAGELESVTVDYQYTSDHGIDFSALKNAPLKVETFADVRDNTARNFIGNIPSVANQGVKSERPVAEIVRDAFAQAFAAGDAPMTDDNPNVIFGGEVLDVSADLDQEDNEFQVTIKTKVALKNASKTLWQNTLFARGSAPREQGVTGAIGAALDRLVEELMYDDYFLFQVVD